MNYSSGNNKIINREISWLSFNERVLQEAADKSVPLIERFRFLGIFSNNRDEFFKVRVASIKRTIEFEKAQAYKILDADPIKLLNQIQKIVIQQQNKFDEIYNELKEECEKHNVYIINEKQVPDKHKNYLRKYFINHVLPELSPIMLKYVESFPDLKDKSIYLAIKLIKTGTDKHEYVLMEVPVENLSRFVILPQIGDKKYIILLDDVIRYNLPKVFSIFDYDLFEAYTIKITRDAELDIDNDVSKSLLEKIAKGVSGRKKAEAVRFVYDKDIPTDLLDYLIDKMELDSYDHIIQGERYHNFKDFMDFPNLGDKSLEYEPTPSLQHHLIKDSDDILSIIDKRDVFLHVPYHNFANYIKMLRQAAIDPTVVSIKITIYRVARNSKVINALISAARNGKSITAVFELQARFDEESNIYWSRKIQEVGGKVIFGVPGLKVHSKLTLITRKGEEKDLNYAVIGTGNFHEGNARTYCDTFLITSNKKITSEVQKVFIFFENTYRSFKYKHLLVSPLYQRRKLSALIDQEIKNLQNGKPAFIILKLNNLVDKELIEKLYQANNAGIKITIIIRGVCCLIPGIKGRSDNINVISIVGKYLEHTRFFIFCNGGDELIYLSSADWMPRNLDFRVETSVPLYDPEIKKEIMDIVNIQLKDNTKARMINKLQNNKYVTKGRSRKKFDSQIETYKYYQNKLHK
ncbi:MAG: polyphosphate kinase 1 [Bacteroidales bacterium]|nr:polyphosphate kinase 1 [Bacteroidales bacterium]